MARYVYDATVASIYDGDTMRINIDLGFETWRMNEVVRLYGIDAPEVRGTERPQGLASRDWLLRQIPVGTRIVVETIRDTRDKYGRYLAKLYLGERYLNREMVDLGLAVAFMETEPARP